MKRFFIFLAFLHQFVNENFKSETKKPNSLPQKKPQETKQNKQVAKLIKYIWSKHHWLDKHWEHS